MIDKELTDAFDPQSYVPRMHEIIPESSESLLSDTFNDKTPESAPYKYKGKYRPKGALPLLPKAKLLKLQQDRAIEQFPEMYIDTQTGEDYVPKRKRPRNTPGAPSRKQRGRLRLPHYQPETDELPPALTRYLAHPDTPIDTVTNFPPQGVRPYAVLLLQANEAAPPSDKLTDSEILICLTQVYPGAKPHLGRLRKANPAIKSHRYIKLECHYTPPNIHPRPLPHIDPTTQVFVFQATSHGTPTHQLHPPLTQAIAYHLDTRETTDRRTGRIYLYKRWIPTAAKAASNRANVWAVQQSQARNKKQETRNKKQETKKARLTKPG